MKFPLVVALVAALLPTLPADARSRDEQRQERRDEQRQERPDEQRDSRQGRDDRREHRNDGSAAAARQAQQRNGGGRVLSVEPDGSGYRVKVLKDGEVRTHHVED